jgi:hypothetical protein
MKISFRRLTITYIVLVVIGLSSLGLVLDRLNDQWTASADQGKQLRERTLEGKGGQIEGAFRQMHQNLRMISLLPGIRAFAGRNQPKDAEAKYDPASFPDDVRQTVQQIYNNLASNVAVSEVYGVLKDFHPDQGEKPFFMLDELILQDGAAHAADQAAAADEPPEVEDEEYAWFVAQLAAFQEKVPQFTFKSIDEIPLAVSPPMRTCDNSQFHSLSKGDARDARGLSVAVPFYDAQGVFKGMIVAVVRLNVFEAMLTDLPFVVVTDADKAAAEKAGFRLDLPAHPFVLENRTHGLVLTDRRQPDLAATWQKTPAAFRVHPLKFAGVADWQLAVVEPDAPTRGGLAELLFLVGMASVVVGGSFFAMLFLASRLRGVNRGLQSITDQVGASSETINDGAQSLAEKALTASSALEEMSRTLAGFQSVNVSTLALGEQMGKNAQETRTQATRGGVEVQVAIEAVERVSGISKSVDLALTTLKDLAFQTNLLAINASVEAARAGEAGLGFSVVADAVRGLAQKSDEAAKGIEAQMAEARQQIEGAVHKVEGTRRVLQGINEAADRSYTAAEQLRGALESNARSFDDVMSGLGQLEEVNHHNATAAEELSAVAAEFSQHTDELDDKVDEIAELLT